MVLLEPKWQRCMCHLSHSRHYPSHRSTLTLALIVPRAAHTSPHTTRSAVSALTTILCNRPSTPHFEPNQLFNITTSTVSRSDVCDLVWVAQEAGTILVLSVKVHVSGRLLLTREFFDADTLVPCTFIAEPRTEIFLHQALSSLPLRKNLVSFFVDSS